MVQMEKDKTDGRDILNFKQTKNIQNATTLF